MPDEPSYRSLSWELGVLWVGRCTETSLSLSRCVRTSDFLNQKSRPSKKDTPWSPPNPWYLDASPQVRESAPVEVTLAPAVEAGVMGAQTVAEA